MVAVAFETKVSQAGFPLAFFSREATSSVFPFPFADVYDMISDADQ
jgi:hypothetical protein